MYLSVGMCVFQSATMKFKTVREGQQAIILSHLGEGELVVGPKRVSSAHTTGLGQMLQHFYFNRQTKDLPVYLGKVTCMRYQNTFT